MMRSKMFKLAIYFHFTFSDELTLHAHETFFSGVSQLLGEHKLIILPEDFCFDDQVLYITDTIYTLHCCDQTEMIRAPYEMAGEAHLKDYICDKVLRSEGCCKDTL